MCSNKKTRNGHLDLGYVTAFTCARTQVTGHDTPTEAKQRNSAQLRGRYCFVPSNLQGGIQAAFLRKVFDEGTN